MSSDSRRPAAPQNNNTPQVARNEQKTEQQKKFVSTTDNARDHRVTSAEFNFDENAHTTFRPENLKRTKIEDDLDVTTTCRRPTAPSFNRRSAPPKPPSDRTAKSGVAPLIKKRDRASFSAGKLSPLASTDNARDRRVASAESDFDENEHTLFKPQEPFHIVHKNKVDNDFSDDPSEKSSTASRRSSATSSRRSSKTSAPPKSPFDRTAKNIPTKDPVATAVKKRTRKRTSFFGLFSEERKKILKSCDLKPIMIDLSKSPEENLEDHPDEIRPLIRLAIFDERQRKNLFYQIKKRCKKPEKCHIGWLVNGHGLEYELLHANEICGDDDTTTVFFVRFSLLQHVIFIVGFGQHSDRSKVQDHDKFYYDLEFFFFEGFKVKPKPRVVINVADDTWLV